MKLPEQTDLEIWQAWRSLNSQAFSIFYDRYGEIAAFLSVLTRSRGIDRLRKKRSQQQHLQKWEQNISVEHDPKNSSL